MLCKNMNASSEVSSRAARVLFSVILTPSQRQRRRNVFYLWISRVRAPPTWVILTSVSWHTGGLQEFWKHAAPEYLVRGADFFSPRLSNEKMTPANTTISFQDEWIKIIPIFVRSAKKINIYFLMCCRILVISLYVPWDEKCWKSLP